MKVQAIFKSTKSGTAKKTSSAAKQTAAGKKSGGWLGSGSKNLNLDKWYVKCGEYRPFGVSGCSSDSDVDG